MGQGTPLQFIPIGAFLGVDEGIPSLALASVFSGGGNRNVYLDKYGRIRTILGYTRRTRAAILSSVTALPMHGRGMYSYGQRVGNAVTRQLLVFFDNDQDAIEVHVSYDAGITFQLVQIFGATAVGAIPDFAQSGNVLIVTNDSFNSPAFQWDGNAFTQIVNTQLAAVVASDAGVVGQLSGNYQWRVVPVKSSGARKLSSVTSNLIALQGKKGAITWVPDPDVDVTGYEIYRTTGTGKVFYYEGLAAGRLTALWVTNAHDLEIIANRAMSEHGDAPPAGCCYCEAHGQRMWYGCRINEPRTWYYSDAGLPLSVYTENKFDFTDAESFTDIARGAVGNFNKMFVAFLERSIWTVSGSGTFNGSVIDYTQRRTNAVTGTVSHRTVAHVPQGARYRNAKGETQITPGVMLAYLTPRDDIRLFDGNNDTIISYPVTDTLKRLTYAQRRKAFMVTDKTRGEIVWVFPADGSTEPSLAVSWNYHFGTWDSHRDWAFGHAIETDGADDSSILLAVSPTVGVIHKLWEGLLFDGVAITSRIETTCLYGAAANMNQPTLQGQPLISFEKRWRWAEFLLQIASGATVTAEWLAGERVDDADVAIGSRVLANSMVPLLTADGQAVLTADGQAIVVESETFHPFRVPLNKGSDKFSDTSRNPRYLHSRGLRLRLTCTSLAGGFITAGANIAYQLLRGLKRDFVK